MAFTQKELLADAAQHDAKAQGRMMKVTKAMQTAAQVESVQPHPISELALVEDDADPFNGNLNNRRAAARIAAKREVTFGDPEKARADVAQSLKVLPEPEIETGDQLPAIRLTNKTPTLGSPADRKGGKGGKGAPVAQMPSQGQQTATAEPPTGEPPTWKPNA